MGTKENTGNKQHLQVSTIDYLAACSTHCWDRGFGDSSLVCFECPLELLDKRAILSRSKIINRFLRLKKRDKREKQENDVVIRSKTGGMSRTEAYPGGRIYNSDSLRYRLGLSPSQLSCSCFVFVFFCFPSYPDGVRAIWVLADKARVASW